VYFVNVFLTGATGFVGSAILRHCIEKGHHVYALIRKGSEKKLASDERVRSQTTVVHGALQDPASYRDALSQCDAVIHLVGIIRENPSKGATFEKIHVEGTQHLLKAAQENKVKRFIHMSALGARPEATTKYHATKWEAEELVRMSGLDSVIFRPSVIFGPKDGFVNMLTGLIKLPIVPIIGDGQYRLQPVSIRTVAQLFVQALETSHTREAYEVGGPEQLSYNEILDTIGKVMGKARVLKFHQPLWYMKPIVYMMDRFPFFPITRTQLTMLLEENICEDGDRAYRDFSVESIPFEKGIKEYISSKYAMRM
jgi:nucleoside-diphosphate-sugar epimerase